MKAARLNGGLLLRKGAAQPVPGVVNSHPGGLERPPLSAVKPGAKAGRRARQPEGLEASIAESQQGLVRDHFGRVRVSLRLDPHRHLRLKLLAAHSRTSMQEMLIAALDAFLDGEGECVKDGSCSCLTNAGPGREDCAKACDAKAAEAEKQGEPT